MGLTCSCQEWDGETGWVYYIPEDFSKLSTKRSRRCSSCRSRIPVGADCLKFDRERACQHEIEEKIYGDVVPMAPLYHCSECGEIFLNLHAAGYCLDIEENMHDLLAEYHYMTGFSPSSRNSGDLHHEK